MNQVISALERQIKIEEGKVSRREMMLANKDTVLFGEKLQESNPEYLAELRVAVELIKGEQPQPTLTDEEVAKNIIADIYSLTGKYKGGADFDLNKATDAMYKFIETIKG